MPSIKSLPVMSIETYEATSGKLELYRLLDEGRTAVKNGRKRPLADVMADIKQEITNTPTVFCAPCHTGLMGII
jgi:hypothetical protein